MKEFCLNKINLLMMKILSISVRTIIVLVAISSLHVGCKDEKNILNDKAILFSKFPKEDSISFRNIYEFKEGVAGMFKLVDSTLIIFNVGPNTKYFLYNYSLRSGQLSKGYLSKGKGPGEAIGAGGIGVSWNSLWLYDVSLKKILTIDKTKALANNTFGSFNEHVVKSDYYMISFEDSLHFFGVGTKNSIFKVQEVDLISGKEIKNYGKFQNITDKIPLKSLKSAYESFIFTKPIGGKVVLAYRYTDAIEIFDKKANTSIVIHGPEGFDVI